MKTIFSLGLILLLAGCTGYITAERHYNSYVLAYKNDNYTLALNEINQALNIQPKQVKYLNAKGKCLNRLKQYQNALEEYTLALGIKENVVSHGGIAQCYDGLKKWESALEHYEMILRLTESRSQRFITYMHMSGSKKNLKKFEDSYRDLMKAYAIDSTDIEVFMALADVCNIVGKDDESLKHLFKALEIDPEWEDAYINIGFKYQELNQYHKALPFLNKAIEINPESAFGYSNRSFNEYKLGNTDQALDDINYSLKLDHENSYAYKIKALIMLELNRGEIACDLLKTALDKGYTYDYGNEVLDLRKEHCL